MKDLITSSGSLSSSMMQTSSLLPGLKYQQNVVNEMLDSMKENLSYFKETLLKTSPAAVINMSEVDSEEIKVTAEKMKKTARNINFSPSGSQLETEISHYLTHTANLLRLNEVVALRADKQDKLRILNETQHVLSTSQAFLNEAVKSNSDPSELSNLETNVEVALNLVTENFKEDIDDENLIKILELRSNFTEFVTNNEPGTEAEKINKLIEFSRKILETADLILRTESDNCIKVGNVFITIKSK